MSIASLIERIAGRQRERQAARAHQHEQRAGEFDAEVAKVEKRIAKLQRDADAVRQRMLVP